MATLHVSAVLEGPTERVFEALTTSSVHAAFTGGESEIDPVPEGEFSYFDGRVSGTFVRVDRPRLLVQRLRAAHWPRGHEALVTTRLEAADDGSTLVMVREEDVPEDELEAVMRGWGRYWSSLQGFLRREGQRHGRAYLLAQVDVHDPDGFEPCIGRTSETIERYGGTVLDVVRAVDVLEGDWPAGALTALVRFPDAASAREFWTGPENEELKSLRRRTATSHVALCQSLDPDDG